MQPMSRTERAALCNEALEVGADAPTLCEGWTVKDLVVHLLVRERDPVGASGIVVGRLAGLTDRSSNKLAQQDFSALVERVRTGPPAWSVFRVPPLDRLANTVEFFCHHEDIRRAQPGWKPRELTDREQRALWKQVTTMGRAAMRRTGVPVEVVWPAADERSTLSPGSDPVVLSGDPAELVMLLLGRDQHHVSVEGPPDSVSRLGLPTG
jgi:uncharacterized protein (TIGR03085 family)